MINEPNYDDQFESGGSGAGLAHSQQITANTLSVKKGSSLGYTVDTNYSSGRNSGEDDITPTMIGITPKLAMPATPKYIVDTNYSSGRNSGEDDVYSSLPPPNVTRTREANFENAKKNPGITAALGSAAAALLGYQLYSVYQEETDPMSGFADTNRFGDGSSLMDKKPYVDNLNEMRANQSGDGTRRFPDFQDDEHVQNAEEFPSFNQDYSQVEGAPPGGRGDMGGLGGEEEFTTVNMDESAVEGDGEFYDIPLADEEGDALVGAEELGVEGTSMAEVLFGAAEGGLAGMGSFLAPVLAAAGLNYGANKVADEFVKKDENGATDFDKVNEAVSNAVGGWFGSGTNGDGISEPDYTKFGDSP